MSILTTGKFYNWWSNLGVFDWKYAYEGCIIILHYSIIRLLSHGHSQSFSFCFRLFKTCYASIAHGRIRISVRWNRKRPLSELPNPKQFFLFVKCSYCQKPKKVLAKVYLKIWIESFFKKDHVVELNIFEHFSVITRGRHNFIYLIFNFSRRRR